jgi:hypothetical protein
MNGKIKINSESTKQNWTDVDYREYWDAPRAILARLGDNWYFFNSRFDDSLDEYIGHYEVWRMPNLTIDQREKSWESIVDLALERLPNIGLNELPFVVHRNI